MNGINGYDLSRSWFNWCFENPEKIAPNHTALYFFIIEHCNRLGWKKKFGLPTTMAMEAIGMRSYKSYIRTFRDLVQFGFIELVQKSTNQYSANIIALVYLTKAPTKALDKAMLKHSTKQVQSTGESKDSIDKQRTNNKEQINKATCKFNFRSALLAYGFNEKLVDEWIVVRKKKKATNSELAYKQFITQVEKTDMEINELLSFIAVEKQWKSFNASWLEKTNNNYAKTEQPSSNERIKRDLEEFARVAFSEKN